MQECGGGGGLGGAHEEAIELTRRPCRHARNEAVPGNSWVGSTPGLPMGPVEVRCEHAPPPLAQGHQALELAIEFYQANCVGCPPRDPTGELPPADLVTRLLPSSSTPLLASARLDGSLCRAAPACSAGSRRA